jgi:hypothetical protein
MPMALAGMVKVLAFAGPVAPVHQRYLSERPVSCLASGKRWVPETALFARAAACRYRHLKRRCAARRAPLLRMHGDYAGAKIVIEKKMENYFIFLKVPEVRRSGRNGGLGKEASIYWHQT